MPWSAAFTLIALVFSTAPVLRADDARFTASFQTTYQGQYQDLYAEQVERVRLLIHQAQMEVSSRLGLLQYQEGFRLPLTVRFADTAAPGAEYDLAFVHFVASTAGLRQEMVVNLSVCAQHPTDFDTIFYHEMTHAVLLDAIDPAHAVQIPHWVQEGLACYVSGEGDTRVRNIAQHFKKSTVGRAVHDIETPPGTVDYAHAYLAIKFLEDKYSVNAVQGFVRDLIEGKSTADAIQDMTGLTYDVFRQQLQAYTLAAYQDQARPDF